jgi:hypothetical protein
VPLRLSFLHINTTPEDAQVFVNGAFHDHINPAHVEFGEVLVRVERDGFTPQEQTFEIIGPVASVAFDLVQIINESTLVVFTIPTNAQVFVNGVHVGYSTLTHTVPTGTHTIVTRLPGYSSPPYTITVTGNEPEDIIRSFFLLPDTNDPLANLSQPDVEPIPPGGDTTTGVDTTQQPTLPTLQPPTQPPVDTTPPVNDTNVFPPITEFPPGGYQYSPLPDVPDETPWWVIPPPPDTSWP